MKIINALILIAFIVSPAWGLEPEGFVAVDRVTYFGTTDKQLKISWDHNTPQPEFYEVKLYHVERETESPAGIGKTADNSIIFKLPRSGHFIARVRACEGDVCGDWSESINPEVATVDGQPRAWWLYGYVAKPGDIVINANP